MGGTTAKITIIENQKAIKAREFEVDRKARFKKGSGLPLRIPVIEMVEIGAGGGSIARVNKLEQIIKKSIKGFRNMPDFFITKDSEIINKSTEISTILSKFEKKLSIRKHL